MPDDMFFSRDMRSLRRGKRKASRTQTCRPCLVWDAAHPEHKMRGVVMDVSLTGMRVRMIELLTTSTAVVVQLMRDEEFETPLSVPVEGDVVRFESGKNGLTDHGIRLKRKEIKRPGRATMPVDLPKPSNRRRTTTRMHTVDYRIGERRRKPTGR